MMGRAASLLVIILVGLSPLALGSNRPLPWAYNALFTGLCCLIVGVLLLLPRVRLPDIRFGIILPSLALWAAALAWAALQVVPLEGLAVVHPNWSILEGALGEEIAGRISVNPADTLSAITRLLTYAALFLCAFVLARNSDNATLLLQGLVVFAIIFAIYGLARVATGSEKILWFDNERSVTLSSTFINRNSAATYLGIATCAAFSVLVRRGRHLILKVEAGAGSRLEALVRGISGQFGIDLAIFLLLLTSVLLTLSRAGVTATLIALLVGVSLLLVRRQGRGRGGLGAVLVCVIVVAIYAVLEFSGAGVTARLLDTEIAAEARVTVYHDTLAALWDHRWTGSGLGTFQDIYPLYRTEIDGAGMVWDKAHNDYLEILLGLGLPAGSAIVLSIAVLALICLRGGLSRRRNSHFPMIGFMASVLVGIHAFFDFSLQIQAVAMTYALLLAVGAAQSVSDRPQST